MSGIWPCWSSWSRSCCWCGLQLFLRVRALGRAIRATAEDPDTAELVGINARAVYAVAAAIAVATTAVAGVFLAMRATFDPYSGPAQLIFAFEAVVIGGRRLALGHARRRHRARHCAEHRRADRPARLSALPDISYFWSCWRHGFSYPALTSGSAIRLGGAREGRRMRRRSLPVRRWTPGSVISTARACCWLLVLLALVPLAFGANVTERLTTLFVYLILAVMWNALAGYGGLVSVGQQMFFGLGAYATIRLSYFGLDPSISRSSPARCWPALTALPLSPSCCGCAAASSRSATWVIATVVHLLVNFDPLIEGETGKSLIALNAYGPAQRQALRPIGPASARWRCF